jgi:glycosyltransferase involved in cell wall biosynthesis
MLKVGNDKPVVSGLGDVGFSVDGTTVGVIIPAFNQARFLGEAIQSVLAQTLPADEIIVVDDGSTDDPAAVAAQFPTGRLIRQDNRGPSAARNTGLRNSKSDCVVFLDADDRLLSNALESGLACIASHPDCAFVYGGHRLISEDGRLLWPDILRPIKGDAYHALLRGNLVGSPMTALFRRDCLLAVNGFDETLRVCEDYDLYLRLAERYPIASHSAIVAEYRKHGQNTSNDYVAMLKGVLLVLDVNEARSATDPAGRAAAREGRTKMRRNYVSRMLDAAWTDWHAHRDIGILGRDLIQAARWAPGLTMRALVGRFGCRAGKALGRRVLGSTQRTLHGTDASQ